MSWPLGYGKPSCRFDVGEDGTAYVNGVAVTEPNGWIDVTLPASARVRGAPEQVSVRIRIVPDEHGEPFLYAEQIEVLGRRYHGMHGLMMAEGTQWIEPLVRAIHGEIVRRGQSSPERHLDGPPKTPTRSFRAVRPAVQPRSPDDTQETAAASATKPSSSGERERGRLETTGDDRSQPHM